MVPLTIIRWSFYFVGQSYNEIIELLISGRIGLKLTSTLCEILIRVRSIDENWLCLVKKVSIKVHYGLNF